MAIPGKNYNEHARRLEKQASMKLGPEDVSLLEYSRCPHFQIKSDVSAYRGGRALYHCAYVLEGNKKSI